MNRKTRRRTYRKNRKSNRKSTRKNMRRTRRNMRGGFQAEAAGTNAMAYKSPFVTNMVKY